MALALYKRSINNNAWHIIIASLFAAGNHCWLTHHQKYGGAGVWRSAGIKNNIAARRQKYHRAIPIESISGGGGTAKNIRVKLLYGSVWRKAAISAAKMASKSVIMKNI